MLHRIVGMKTPDKILILPPSWAEIKPIMPLSRAYVNLNGLRVLVSIDIMQNNKEYLHISVSREDKLPSWADMKTAKSIFIGTEKEAFHVLPKESEFVNFCKNCLHLWHDLSEDLMGEK